jgi:hypothetical protein
LVKVFRFFFFFFFFFFFCVCVYELPVRSTSRWIRDPVDNFRQLIYTWSYTIVNKKMCGWVKVPDNIGAVGVSEAELLSITNKQYFFFFFFRLLAFPNFPTPNKRAKPALPLVKKSLESTKKKTQTTNRITSNQRKRDQAPFKKKPEAQMSKKKKQKCSKPSGKDPIQKKPNR